ncbi:MAG: GAF domain-containing protein [Patescibacteria group bacterium]
MATLALADPEKSGRPMLDILFDRMPVGIAVLDRDLVLVRTNPTWAEYVARYTRTPREKVVPGARFADLAPGTENTSMRRFRQALAGGTVREQGVPMESGGIVSYWDVVVTPLIQDGAVVGIIDVTTDATERKLAEEALREHRDHLEEMVAARTAELTVLNERLQGEINERALIEGALRRSEEEYRELVENANSIILRMDTAGNVTFFNEFAQRFFGYGEAEILGRNVLGTIVPETETSGRDLGSMIGDLTEHPDRYSANINENMRRNGERVWVAWTNKAVRDGSGRVVGVLCVGNDITELRSVELALAKAHEKLERQMAETKRRVDEIQTLFAVQQAITRRLDPDAVMQLIADEARRLTGSRRTAVFTCVEGGLRVSVLSGGEDPGLLGWTIPAEQSVTGRCLRLGGPVRVLEIGAAEAADPEIQRRPGIRCLLAVPLISGEVQIGAISVADKLDGAYSEEDEWILTMLASSAVIGLENARLYRAEQDRRREAEQRRQVAEGLRDILAILNSARPLSEMLDYIIAQAGRLLGTDAGAIYRLHPDEDVLTIQAARGLSPEYVAGISIPMGDGAVGRAVALRRPVVVDDIRAQEDLWQDRERRRLLAWLIDRYTSVFSVPLLSKDRVYGGIVLYYRSPRRFTEEEIELAVSFAGQAALAIENTQLRAQAEENAVAAERSRLARDLHDAVTQTLFSASLIAEVLPRIWERDQAEGRRRLEELRQLTRGALAEMRTLLLELRPATLVEVGLDDLLRQLAEATTGRARVPVGVEVRGICNLPPDAQIAFYRIAQEALNNVAKHSGAGRAEVVLSCLPGDAGRDRGGRVELHIRDDGRGFDPARISPEHLGLGIMRERAEAIGAKLRVESGSGRGTEIIVTWREGSKEDGHE